MASAKPKSGLRISARKMESGRIPWRLRFQAWWDGYEVAMPGRQLAAIETPDRDHHVRAPENRLPWDDLRIGLVQQVWGDGFDRPGGNDDVLALLKPCAVDPSMSVIELGAGLGGGTRAVCRAFGLWMQGLETEPELARVGQSLSDIAGLKKKAPVVQSDLSDLKLKSGLYDVIFAREAFVSLANKGALMQMLRRGLKGRGQLLFTDYVLADEVSDDAALDAWREGEVEPPTPWRVTDYMDSLNDLKFDIRISEDRSDRQIAAIKGGWADFMETAAQDGRLQTYGDLALEEAALWNRRLKALESGALRVYRFHAIKPNSDKTLADW